MTTTTLDTSAFAAAVRAALSDLPPDDVDELTDGLEADLAERAADEKSDDFGDPVAYANELRASAGLSPRGRERASTLPGAFRAAGRELGGDLKRIYAHPLVARIGAFFVALRPLWWVFRAWAFYGILTGLFHIPSLRLTPLTFVLGAGALIVSVQFGRGKWLPKTWMRKTLLAVNVILVLFIPVILIATSSAITSDSYSSSAVASEPNWTSGLQYNGHEVTNIFAYDASGNPLTNVQLFDQHGKPLNTVVDPDHMKVTYDSYYYVPSNEVVGRPGWNVYPLLRLNPSQLTSDGQPKPGAIADVVKPHAATVPPLVSLTPTATAPPTPTPSPTPKG